MRSGGQCYLAFRQGLPSTSYTVLSSQLLAPPGRRNSREGPNKDRWPRPAQTGAAAFPKTDGARAWSRTCRVFSSGCAFGCAAKAGAERTVSNAVARRNLLMMTSVFSMAPTEPGMASDRCSTAHIGTTFDYGLPDLAAPNSQFLRSGVRQRPFWH